MDRPGAVSLEGVSYSYGRDGSALHNVSLAVAPAERVALVGPNGAGKSTLLLTIVGILRARGTIRVSGIELAKANLKEVRRRAGLVFQNADDQLFMPTVREDVAFGPAQLGLTQGEVDERVAAALRQVGMEHLAAREPHHLSGGEKRAASVATVLPMHPEVLLLDEPTAGLDPRSRRRLIDVLRALDVTLLVATHDLEMALSLCDRTVVLDAGEVVRDGPSREVMSDASLMEAHGLEVPLSVALGGATSGPS